MTSERRYVHANMMMRRYHLKRLNLVINKLRFITKTSGKRKLTFLDAGCGDGTYELLLERDFDYLVGLDLTRSNLKIAKEYAKDRNKVDFILADAEHLPFRDLSVDIVLCSEVLEHLYDPLQALSELLRIFRNTLLLTVPVETISKKIAKILKYNNRLRKIETDIGHVSMHNSQWWTDIIYRTSEMKQVKWYAEVDHSYLSAEPFTTIFGHLRNETLFRATDKTLDIIEKILAHPMFANHLMITLTV